MSSDPASRVAPAQIGDETPSLRHGLSITPIGVDVGTKQLATAATAAGPHGGPAVDERKYIRQLYSEFCSATERLSLAPEYDETTLDDLVDRYWPRFEAAFTHAAEEVITYAQQHESPMIVLEDLPVDQQPLRACRNGNVRLAAWCPPAVQSVLVKCAVKNGLPVTYVDPHDTSKECHRCGERGKLGEARFRCTNDACPIDDVCRDRGAAATIARRGLEQR